MLVQGIYEQLINKLVSSKLNEIDKNQFYIQDYTLDKAEASQVLSRYLQDVMLIALNNIVGDNSLEQKIILCNKIISYLCEEFSNIEFEENLIDNQAKILSAIFSKKEFKYRDFDKHIKEITPYTRLSQSELFTGSNAGVSLESEIKKEILSSNKISFLVSFIKWSGIRIFEKELTEFTDNGGQLKIITTSYMGATDLKAVEYLSGLKNTQIKISYNTKNERLHAKSYLFKRNTGFDTAYIGSSNLSRSALTSGLEWNLKITSKEVKHIIDKFQKTFETYWEDEEFESFNLSEHREKFRTALNSERQSQSNTRITYFDIKPYPYQKEILDKLNTERLIHKRTRNLVVAATGTGKTIISAFDFKQFRIQNSKARLLFVAHRKEILQQAQEAFRGVLKDYNFGDLWVDGIVPEQYNSLFASVQTLKNRIEDINLPSDYFDFIIIDEVHHITASTYRPILEYFNPKVLLGLTATPERMDNANVLDDFSGRIAAEIRLPAALNRKLLCPFQYFGITDTEDLSKLSWKNGRYLPSELTKLYTANDNRMRNIIHNLKKYLRDDKDVRALCFCVSVEHAEYMAEKMLLAGYKADYLVANRSRERDALRDKFQKKEINYLFVVDIFNEGVDIPEIDTVLFLRPTESLTIFLQQLGRGLRLADNKDCLTVLDFVGNSRPEYNYESKFRALVGKSNNSIEKEILDDFPNLPLGCSIVLERKTKEIIVDNIHKATNFNVNKLIGKIRSFKNDTDLEFNIANFIGFYRIPIETIYSKGISWSALCAKAGVLNYSTSTNEKDIYRAISKKWITCSSYSYFKFILDIAKKDFIVDENLLSKEEKLMLLMLHYDVWLKNREFASIENSISAIGEDTLLRNEIIEVINILIGRIDYIETDIELDYITPLKLHSRYTRDQILVAFGFSTFHKKSSSREGVAENKDLNTELLFVDMIKSEKDFSPTTLYNDYAISDTLFHWQSQNASRPDIGKGLSYVNHVEKNKTILLFVREKNKNQYNNTMAYVFLGKLELQEHKGSKPMNIKWQLEEPMPAYMWKQSAKMAVG